MVEAQDTGDRTKAPSPPTSPYPFGVGCFHFELKGEAGGRLVSPDRYVSTLKDYLAQYPNIDSIEVENYHTTDGREEAYDADVDGGISSGFGITPWPSNWSYRFNIKLPIRLQKELSVLGRVLSCESLSVTIYYVGGLPVAIVNPDDRSERRPSTAVVLLRRYLEKYAPKSDAMTFRFIGPSPFHADFFVEFAGDKEEIVSLIDVQRGYDDVLFVAPADTPEDERSIVLREIQEGAAEELGEFYFALQARNRFQDKWGALSGRINVLIDEVRIKRSALRPRYTVQWRRDLEDVLFDLMAFKLEIEEVEFNMTSGLDELARKSGRGDLKQYAEEYIAELRRIPTKDAFESLTLLESRSRAEAQNLSTIQGALIGSVATVVGVVIGWMLK